MNKWKTGKPTETGDYLIKFRAGTGRIKVDTDHYSAKGGNWYWYPDRVIRWTEIPKDEEDEA